MAITGGVGEALIATVTGLMVATFALLGHSYFGYRLDSMVTDMERLGSLLEDRLAVLPQQNAKERGQAKHEAA
jgi:biopolymer transport protein ExbB